MDTHQLFYLHFLCKSNNSTKIHKKIKPLLNLNNNFDKLFFNFLIVIKYPNIDINYNKNI